MSPICISPMSWAIDSGIAVGRASTFSSRVICSSTPPSLTPGASSMPIELERHDGVDRLVQAHPQQVDVHGLPAHRVALSLLEHDRRRFAAVDAQIEHRARAGERQAQLARVGVEAHRLAAAAVEHAGHAAGAAQAPRRARALRGAAAHVELGRLESAMGSRGL